MLSCLLLSMCALTVCLCFFFLYQITDMQTVVHFSELWPKQTVYLDSYVGCIGLAQAADCIHPSPSSVLLCQFSFPFIHVSSPQTTFMTKHGLIPSEWCLRIPQWNPQILQRYHSDGSREEEAHFALMVSGTGLRRHWAERWEKPDIIKDL